MNETFKLGCLVTSALALAMQLGGCDTAEPGDAPCASNADCALGQVCNVGTCVTGGTAVAGAGGGSSAGSGHGGGVNPSAGTASQAGSASGGNSSTGGSFASGGASGSGNAGSSTLGGASGAGGSGGGASGSPNVPSQCKDDFWPGANNGSVTRYDFKQGTSLPACSYVITHTGSGSDGDWDTVEGIATGDGGYFGAMNTTDYAQGAACGACVEAGYNGRKVVLTIVDECPVSTNPLCTKGHIDLSRKAIRQLEPNGSLENLKNVSWRYVQCPASGNVKTRLHPNQNPDWQPVVIENGLFPLKSVTLNGVSAMRTGNNAGGNAWIATGQKAPYTVRATDVNNGSITFSYGDSGLKDVGAQFTCQ